MVAGLLFSGAVALAACGSSSAPAALASCSAARLAVSQSHRPEAGLGHAGNVVLLHNSGTSTCTLRGYPTVTLFNDSNIASNIASVTASKTPSGYLGGLASGSTAPPLVTLTSGGVASFLVEGTDVPVGASGVCPTYGAMRFVLPGTSTSKPLGASLPGCSRPEVHPIVAGPTGSQPG